MQKTFPLILTFLVVVYHTTLAGADLETHSQVIVIGAGISGLAAAHELQERGHEVLVLEARDRIGGRIWTHRDGDGLTLDMGASWIHGLRKNPLTKMAKELDLALIETDYDSYRLYDSQRKAREDADWSLDSLEERIYRALERTRHVSVQQGIESQANTVQKGNTTQREIDFVVNTMIEHEFAADADDLSITAIEEGEEFGGPDALFPKGYDQITDHLAKGLEIKREQVVTHIDFQNPTTILTTQSGTRYTADYVLVTVPLGVLKENRIQFKPPLPAKKQAAIQSLGMGLLNKVYLQFPEVFWEEEVEVMGFVSDEKGRWAEWYTMTAATGKPVLLGFVAGSYAEKMETLTDQAVVEDAMEVLQVMFGADIPKPIGFYVTRWRADPFAGGSYSYLKVGAHPVDRRRLGATVENKLFFAGEATDPDYPATVHGALRSGLREATKIHNRIEQSR